MKKFRFKLHAVQTLREREENAAIEKYAAALEQQRQASLKAQQARQNLFHLQTERNQQVQQGCAIREFAQFHGFVTVLRERLQECEALLQRETQRSQEAFQAMLRARQKLEVVQKYREREQHRHDASARQAEQKQMDEFLVRKMLPAEASTPWS